MTGKAPPPIPQPPPLCAFPECTETGCFGFREPGIANLAHRNPEAIEVWACRAHREHGEQILKVKVYAAAQERGGAIAMAARRGEGKLL